MALVCVAMAGISGVGTVSADAAQAYTVSADTTSSNRSNNLTKSNSRLYASLTVSGITYGYSTVYVWVKSGNGAYITDTLTCIQNYSSEKNLYYSGAEQSDISDMQTRNFYVYARYDSSSRVTSGSISGNATV